MSCSATRRGRLPGQFGDKKGKFELAAGGTIFLDEVGDIPLESQVKLLRVLQEREFDRVGGERTLKADVRVIAATNKDLEEEVEQGRFREDLYYRLDVIPIRMPALRERRDDILALAAHFLISHANELGREVAELTSEAKRVLLDYEWPGNVRQLDHEMMRVTTLSEPGSPITIDLLSEKLRSSGEQSVRDSEKTGCLKGPARAHRASVPRRRAGQQSVESDDDGGANCSCRVRDSSRRCRNTVSMVARR